MMTPVVMELTLGYHPYSTGFLTCSRDPAGGQCLTGSLTGAVASERVSEALKGSQERTGNEVRVTVPGHMQRGGSPCAYDRVLCTQLGAHAAKLILDEDYGYMVGMINGQTKKVPLGELAGKLKMVQPDCQLIKEAKIVGICFGD